MLQPPQRASTSGGLSAFEELAAAGNPWRQKQQLGSAAASAGRAVSLSITAGGPHTGGAAVATSRLHPQSAAASHLIAQQPNRQTAQQQPKAAAATAPADDVGGIAAGWGSSERIRASADLDAAPAELAKSAASKSVTKFGITTFQHPLGQPPAVAAATLQQTNAAEPPKSNAQRQQQQPAPAAVLTATSMQLALRLRDYCELIRSVCGPDTASCALLQPVIEESTAAAQDSRCFSCGEQHTTCACTHMQSPASAPSCFLL